MAGQNAAAPPTQKVAGSNPVSRLSGPLSPVTAWYFCATSGPLRLVRFVLAVCAAALLLGAPAALAASADVSDGIAAAGAMRIYACVAGDHRTLNLTTKNAHCPRRQTKIAWNVTGVEGKRGPKGSTGSKGSTGAQGPAGSAGAAGTKGDTGGTGSAGPVGSAGATGAQGDTGPSGGSMLIAGGPVTLSSALGGLPLATTLLPISGQLSSGNTTSYPPSALDPAIVAAAQVVPTDITITGFRFVYSNTVTAFTLSTPIFNVTLYEGQPGGPYVQTPVGCTLFGTSPMPLGYTTTCSGTSSLAVAAGSMLYVGVTSMTNESTTFQGQVDTGFTTS